MTRLQNLVATTRHQKSLASALREETSRRLRAEALLAGQEQVMELVASGAPLPEALDALVRLIESQAPDMSGSILLLDDDGVHVRHGAAPNLPAEFVAAVNGQPIGPCAGSCGTAAYRKEAVFVEDIATDPLWAQYKAAALPHGLRACWSTPIFDASRRVLGTFAMYYRQPARPQPEHLGLIDIATHIAAVAISRQRAAAELRARTDELHHNFTHGMGQLEELRRWQAVIVEREIRMQELKREVNTLLAERNDPPRYPDVDKPGTESSGRPQAADLRRS